MVYVRTDSFGWDTIFWEFNDGGRKKACRKRLKKELRKKVETLNGLSEVGLV